MLLWEPVPHRAAGSAASGTAPSPQPNSPACSWLSVCLETRKLTEHHQRDEAPTELVLASNPLNSTAANTSLLLHLPWKNLLQARNSLCSTAERKQPTENFAQDQVLSSLNSITNILQRLNPYQDVKPPCISPLCELEETLRTRLWMFSFPFKKKLNKPV